MIYGNWVAIHKGFTKHLPIDRPYTELEAIFSLSVDIDNQNHGSIAGYSKLWSWSRNKVRKFFSDIGVEIVYPENTGKIQNQKGQIEGQIVDRSGTDKGQIRYIIDKGLYGQKDRSGTDKGQIRDRSKDTTIDPINPKPKKNNTILKPDNVTEQTWDDFLTHRKNLKATVTKTVLTQYAAQAEKAGVTLEYAFKESILRGWRGFKADWVKKATTNHMTV
jgi:hypothetical protein